MPQCSAVLHTQIGRRPGKRITPSARRSPQSCCEGVATSPARMVVDRRSQHEKRRLQWPLVARMDSSKQSNTEAWSFIARVMTHLPSPVGSCIEIHFGGVTGGFRSTVISPDSPVNRKQTSDPHWDTLTSTIQQFEAVGSPSMLPFVRPGHYRELP